MIIIVVSRVGVAAVLVAVLANMEVEVEETCIKLAMSVPVASGLKAETADADNGHHPQDQPGQPEDPNHGSAKATHLGSPR